MSATQELHTARDVTLVELVDRLLDKGVVLAGDVTISVADVPLVYLGLRVLLSSVETAERFGAPVPGAGAVASSATGADALGIAPRGDAFDSDALDAEALDSDGIHEPPPRTAPRSGPPG